MNAAKPGGQHFLRRPESDTLFGRPQHAIGAIRAVEAAGALRRKMLLAAESGSAAGIRYATSQLLHAVAVGKLDLRALIQLPTRWCLTEVAIAIEASE